MAAGTITRARAQAARDRVTNSPNGLPPFGIDGRRGGKGGGGDEQALQAAEATFFGITPAQLQQDLAAAGSLQGVAAKYGKDTATDKATLQAALAAGESGRALTLPQATALACGDARYVPVLDIGCGRAR